MYNLYNVKANVEALRKLVRSLNRPSLRELDDVYLKYEAPISRNAAGGKRSKLASNVRKTASLF